MAEINESFAPEVLNLARESGLGLDRINVNGGGIALGHPLGASSARITVTLLHTLARRQGRLGLVASSAAGGQSVALVVARH